MLVLFVTDAHELPFHFCRRVSILRFDCFPDRLVRLSTEATAAPRSTYRKAVARQHTRHSRTSRDLIPVVVILSPRSGVF